MFHRCYANFFWKRLNCTAWLKPTILSHPFSSNYWNRRQLPVGNIWQKVIGMVLLSGGRQDETCSCSDHFISITYFWVRAQWMCVFDRDAHCTSSPLQHLALSQCGQRHIYLWPKNCYKRQTYQKERHRSLFPPSNPIRSSMTGNTVCMSHFATPNVWYPCLYIPAKVGKMQHLQSPGH